MNIWLITIGEQLPINQQIRKLRTAYLADELLGRGHKVRWWASAFDHFKKEWLVKSDKEIKLHDDFKINLLKGRGYKRNISISRFLDHRLLGRKFRKLARNFKKPDIIIASMPAYDLAYEAVKFGKSHGVPVLVDIRDQWPDIFVDKSPLPKGITRMLLATEFRMLKSVMKEATGILAVSDAFMHWGIDYAGREMLPADAVFYLGYRKNKNFLNQDSAFQEQMAKLEGKFVVTFVGTFEEFHDPRILVECAAHFQNEKDIFFVLAGDGHYKAEIEKKIAHLSNIILTGWLDQSQIDMLLSRSSVGVCTTPLDAKLFPNKAFSYFAFGLPVISAFQGDLRRVLHEYSVGFYYPPNDAKQLINHINTLKNSLELYNQLSANSIALYNDKLDGELIYKKYADHVETIANKHIAKLC